MWIGRSNEESQQRDINENETTDNAGSIGRRMQPIVQEVHDINEGRPVDLVKKPVKEHIPGDEFSPPPNEDKLDFDDKKEWIDFGDHPGTKHPRPDKTEYSDEEEDSLMLSPAPEEIKKKQLVSILKTQNIKKRNRRISAEERQHDDLSSKLCLHFDDPLYVSDTDDEPPPKKRRTMMSGWRRRRGIEDMEFINTNSTQRQRIRHHNRFSNSSHGYTSNSKIYKRNNDSKDAEYMRIMELMLDLGQPRSSTEEIQNALLNDLNEANRKLRREMRMVMDELHRIKQKYHVGNFNYNNTPSNFNYNTPDNQTISSIPSITPNSTLSNTTFSNTISLPSVFSTSSNPPEQSSISPFPPAVSSPATEQVKATVAVRKLGPYTDAEMVSGAQRRVIDLIRVLRGGAIFGYGRNQKMLRNKRWCRNNVSLGKCKKFFRWMYERKKKIRTSDADKRIAVWAKDNAGWTVAAIESSAGGAQQNEDSYLTWQNLIIEDDPHFDIYADYGIA